MMYLFAAYSVIWLAIFGYLIFIDRKLNRLSAEVDFLRQSNDKIS
ncbi:MAG: hypothetical protein IEMM0002_0060 [bacterium]|nr:MAG: hypothetical protein IEMM0002_0060 [bacterium]